MSLLTDGVRPNISRRSFVRGLAALPALRALAGAAALLGTACTGARTIAGFAGVNPQWARGIANMKEGEISVSIDPRNLRIARRIDLTFIRTYVADTRYNEARYSIIFPDIDKTVVGSTMNTSEQEVTLGETDIKALQQARPDGTLRIQVKIESAGDWYFRVDLKRVDVRSWINTLESHD